MYNQDQEHVTFSKAEGLSHFSRKREALTDLMELTGSDFEKAIIRGKISSCDAHLTLFNAISDDTPVEIPKVEV